MQPVACSEKESSLFFSPSLSLPSPDPILHSYLYYFADVRRQNLKMSLRAQWEKTPPFVARGKVLFPVVVHFGRDWKRAARFFFFLFSMCQSVGRPAAVCTSEDSFSLSSLLLLLLLHLVAIILRTFLSPSRSSDLCCWGTQNLLINRQINSPPSSIMQFRMAQKSQPAVYEIKYRRFDFHACRYDRQVHLTMHTYVLICMGVV